MPAADARGPAQYRTKMAGVMLTRALPAPSRAPAAEAGRRQMAKSQVSMTVNGKTIEALVEPRTLLIHFLREQVTSPAHISAATPVIAAPARSTLTASR